MSLLFLIGCTNKAQNEYDLSQLTRVDVEVVKADDSYEETYMITDVATLLF